MNQSQMLLILGSIVIFSFITVNAHRSVLAAAQMRLESEYVITAAEIGESVLSEIKNKAFDQATANGQEVDNLNDLTIHLGPGSSEYPGSYNDVDDYITDYSKNKPLAITVPRSGLFSVVVAVAYVQPNQPNTVSASPTWMKRITVTVTSSLLAKPVVLNSYASY